MAFDYIYFRDESNSNNLSKVDNDTGDLVETIDLGGDVFGVDRDTDGYVYVAVGSSGRKLRKYSADMSNQVWETYDSVYSDSIIRVGPDENYVYTAGDYWLSQVDASTGQVQWTDSNYLNGAGFVTDMSFDRGYMYLHQDTSDRYPQMKFLSGLGSLDSEAPIAGDQTPASGILVTDDWFIGAEYDASVLKRRNIWNEGNQFSESAYSTRNCTNLEANKSGLYSAGTDGRVAHVGFDGNVLWETQLDGVSNPIKLDVSPDAVWLMDDTGLYQLDPDTGSLNWQNNSVSQSDPGYTLGGFPSIDCIGRENYYVPMEVSGTVVDGGSAVSGAKVTVIDDTNNNILATTTTDSNGNWSAEAADTRLHVIAQYQDDSGTEYNTTSYPYVNSQ